MVSSTSRTVYVFDTTSLMHCLPPPFFPRISSHHVCLTFSRWFPLFIAPTCGKVELARGASSEEIFLFCLAPPLPPPVAHLWIQTLYSISITIYTYTLSYATEIACSTTLILFTLTPSFGWASIFITYTCSNLCLSQFWQLDGLILFCRTVVS